MGSPSPLSSSLCHGACGACLGFWGPPSASRGLCALVSAPQAWPLHPASSVDLSGLPLPALCVVRFVCTCFLSPPALFLVELMCFTLLSAVLRGLCVLPKFVCLPCLGTPGLPFVPQGLCGVLGFVCCASLSYLCPPSVLKGLCALARFVCLPEAYSQCLSLLSGWGHNPGAVNRLRSSTFSVYRPLKSLLCPFSKTLQLPLAPIFGGASLCLGTLPVSGPTPSAHKFLPKFSIFSLFNVSILSPTSFQGA